MSRNRQIENWNYSINVEFDGHPGTNATEKPAMFEIKSGNLDNISSYLQVSRGMLLIRLNLSFEKNQ